MSLVPLIRQRLHRCHLPPRGRLRVRKRHLSIKHTSAASGARGITGRTDAPVPFPLSTGSRPSTKKGICEQVSTRDFSLGVWGGISFPREKKCPPESRTFDVQALNIQTPKLSRKAPHRIRISGTFCPSSSQSPLGSVSPCGENSARSLAPPLPNET